jgi:hypothetical protein
MIRTDTLTFSIYTRHGDSCGCENWPPNTCISRCQPNDYVLAAKFSYLQEALDVVERWQKRGVACKLRTDRPGCIPRFDWSDYPAKTPNMEVNFARF